MRLMRRKCCIHGLASCEKTCTVNSQKSFENSFGEPSYVPLWAHIFEKKTSQHSPTRPRFLRRSWPAKKKRVTWVKTRNLRTGQDTEGKADNALICPRASMVTKRRSIAFCGVTACKTVWHYANKNKNKQLIITAFQNTDSDKTNKILFACLPKVGRGVPSPL